MTSVEYSAIVFAEMKKVDCPIERARELRKREEYDNKNNKEDRLVKTPPRYFISAKPY